MQEYVYLQIWLHMVYIWACQVVLVVKNPPANAEDMGSILGQKIPVIGNATHSSIFAWKIPWTEEPGGLQSMGWQRVKHD